MLSILLFLFGSVIAAVAQTVITLLAGRCIQGIGGGGATAPDQFLKEGKLTSSYRNHCTGSGHFHRHRPSPTAT